MNNSDRVHAITLQREILRLTEQREPVNKEELYLAQNDLALMLSGQPAEREALYRTALEGRISAYGEESVEVGETMHNLGEHLQNFGRITEAEPLIRKALAVHSQICGPLHWRSLMAGHSLGMLFYMRGEYEDAITQLGLVLESKERTLGPKHFDTISTVNSLGLALLEVRRFHEAEPLFRRSMETRKEILGLSSWDTANGVAGYAMVLMHLQRDDEAKMHASEALDIWRRVSCTEDDPRSGKAYWVLGTAAIKQGDPINGKRYLNDAIEMLRKGHAETHPWVVAIRTQLEQCV